MKQVIVCSGQFTDDTVVFTPAGVLELLSQIHELDDYDLSLFEAEDGVLHLQVGESAYKLPTMDATDISIEPEAVSVLDAVNDIAYENIDEAEGLEVIEDSPIESGVLKELAKTLLIGGMVRLSKKLLTN